MAAPLLVSLFRIVGVFVFTVLGVFHGAASAKLAQDQPSRSPSYGTAISHHDLSLTIDPASHRLIAHDHMKVFIPLPRPDVLRFTLAPTLHVTHLRVQQEGRTIPVTFTSAVQLSTDLAGESTQTVTMRLSEPVSEGALIVDWQYEGVVHDPPREPRHLRFVTPSDTSGYIGVEGVYLSGESQWYPDQAGSLPTFRVQVTLPKGWLAVTHGWQTGPPPVSDRETVLTTTWEVPEPTEALTLVANQFVRTVREWSDRAGNTVLLETDLLPDNSHLAGEYLDASARYIEAYSRLLGPYPFAKFAVVENFFASGLGMPSFTLLGSSVIKRHYVQSYALGHEIVHSWIGNAVFNRPETGNWVEGLTTYLANYYYDEMTGHEAQATEQRRLMVVGYAVYVPQDGDYPLARFMRKTDQKDNAIGYQKAAMVFHMLRRDIGESAFWGGIKQLGEQYRGQYVDWGRLEEIFSRQSQKSLRVFFSQWVERAGAPEFTISARNQSPVASQTASNAVVAVQIEQAEPPFRMALPVVAVGRDGRPYEMAFSVSAPAESYTVSVPFDPVEIQVDPDFQAFRRIDRAELPPMLNLLVTDVRRKVMVSSSRGGEEASVYRRIVERMTSQEPTASTSVRESIEEAEDVAEASLLFLGADQRNAWAQRAEQQCAERIGEEDGKLVVDGTAYEGPQLALLVSCHRKNHPGHVVTLFYGTSPEAAGKVARLLFFYGWQSYLVFRDGAVVGRGDFANERGLVQIERN